MVARAAGSGQVTRLMGEVVRSTGLSILGPFFRLLITGTFRWWALFGRVLIDQSSVSDIVKRRSTAARRVYRAELKVTMNLVYTWRFRARCRIKVQRTLVLKQRYATGLSILGLSK